MAIDFDELRERRKDRRRLMRRRVVRQAKKQARKLSRDGSHEQAGQIYAVLGNAKDREDFVEGVLDEFYGEVLESNEALGDGEIFKYFLNWLTEGGGMEAIIKMIQVIFSLAGGL